MKVNLAKKLLFLLICALLGGAAVCAYFGVRSIWLDASLSGDLSRFYRDPFYQKDLLLAGFPVYSQQYSNSCGPTTLSMVKSFLEAPIREADFSRQMGIQEGKSGMLPAQFAHYLQLGLPRYRIHHLRNLPDEELLEKMYLQLQNGIPVPIYFSTPNAWDKPNYDTHYSAVIGMQPARQTVILANAYGFQETVRIPEFLASLKYRNYQNPPLIFRLGMFFGIIERNNLFLIQRR